MMPELLIPFAVFVVLMVMLVMRANSQREEAWRNTIEGIVSEHKDTIDKAIRLAKADTVEEAVRAETVEKSHELQLKVMQDTLAEVEAVEEEKSNEDTFKVHTADGREIDLRQWEIVG